MGTDLKGTNLIGLSKCAEQLGFNCRAVKVDREGFLSRYTLPAIANIITKEGMSHFVVVFSITKKYVIVGNPAKDIEIISIDDFYKKFTGAMLLLKPNSEFEREKIKGTKLFDRYIKLLLPQKKLFIYALVASLLVTILGILSSLFNNIIYDEILPYRQKDVLKIMLAVFLGISLTSTFLRCIYHKGYFYKYSIIAYHGYINGSYYRCDTVSDEPKAFCDNCNDDNHKYSAGIYI